jgi:excisionase family DNA binding protein
MPQFSLRQAAQQAGTSKSTILRAIQNGRLSATRTDDGGYAIDPAELHRVYGDKAAQRAANDAKGQDAPGDATAALQAEIAGLRAQVDLMRTALDDAKEQRAAWQRQAESAQRLLTDQTGEKRRGWFGLGRTG